MLENYMQQGWVVPDLDAAMKKWTALGAGPFFITRSEMLPEREWRGRTGRDHFIAAHTFLGSAQIELIQPTTTEPSIFRELMDVRGETLHHIQPNCGPLDADGFDERARNYRNLGYERVFAMTLPGVARIEYYDARKALGIFIELAERPQFMHQIGLGIYKAHLEWDRKTDAVRENTLARIADEVGRTGR